jgi:hypothetical protein
MLTTRYPLTIRGGGDPRQAWLARRLREWACRLGALPLMRMTASWSGSASDPPNTSVWRDRSRSWRAPLGSSARHLQADQTSEWLQERPGLAIHRPFACTGVKALRSTSCAKACPPRRRAKAGRHAAKLRPRFGPLTPCARSASLIAGDGTKNGLPAPNKELAQEQKRTSTGLTVRATRET